MWDDQFSEWKNISKNVFHCIMRKGILEAMDQAHNHNVVEH